MSDAVTRVRAQRTALLIALTVALAGAVWSVLKGDGCGSCNSAQLLVGDLNLGLIGLVFYAGLLGWSLWMLRRAAPPAPAIPWSVALPVLAAGGVHLTLLGLLLKNHLVCASCFTSAAGAFAATAVVLGSGSFRLHWAAATLALVAGVTFVGLKAAKGNAGQVAMRQANYARAMLLREDPPAAGVARLVVFVHPTCHVCKRFKATVLTPLREEFPREQLLIEERPAWAGMATPTSVVLGAQPALLVGFNDLPVVRHAIQAARGAAPETRAAALAPARATGSPLSAAH